VGLQYILVSSENQNLSSNEPAHSTMYVLLWASLCSGGSGKPSGGTGLYLDGPGKTHSVPGISSGWPGRSPGVLGMVGLVYLLADLVCPPILTGGLVMSSDGPGMPSGEPNKSSDRPVFLLLDNVCPLVYLLCLLVGLVCLLVGLILSSDEPGMSSVGPSIASGEPGTSSGWPDISSVSREWWASYVLW
jgi:hypothetical protein